MYVPPTPAETSAMLGIYRSTSLAKRLDVHPRTIAKWRSGERVMPFCTLYAVIGVLIGISVEPDHWRHQLRQKNSTLEICRWGAS